MDEEPFKASMEDSSDVERNDNLPKGISHSDEGMREQEEGSENRTLGEGGISDQGERHRVRDDDERYMRRDEQRDRQRDKERDRQRDKIRDRARDAKRDRESDLKGGERGDPDESAAADSKPVLTVEKVLEVFQRITSVNTPTINSKLAVPFEKTPLKNSSKFMDEYIGVKSGLRKVSGGLGKDAYQKEKERRKSFPFAWPQISPVEQG